MPSFPRTRCRDGQELHLWDECAAREADLHRYRSLLDSISRSIAESRAADQPPDRVEATAAKSLVSAGAARARCFRRGLSDEARRRAIDHARELGALPPDFDESVLPWKDEPPVHPESAPEPRHPEPPSDLLVLHPNLVPRREEEANRFVADRLARLDYRNGTRRLPPQPSVTSIGGLVCHADGAPAVLADSWMYAMNKIARGGPRFTRLGEDRPFLDISQPGALDAYRREVLELTAHTYGSQVADDATRGLASLDAPMQVLALLELELEYRIAHRHASYAYESPQVETMHAADRARRDDEGPSR